MADWQAIKTEYITTQTSYRKLAQKYGIHYKVISERGKDEKWVELRSQYQDKTLTKTLNKISDKQSDKMARIDQLTDKLLDKLEQAIEELDLQLAKHTDKTKTIEYKNDLRPDKPTREVVHEEEKLLEVKRIVDRQGLKQIASALRDIKEVKMLRTELDRQEQEARIANLRRQVDKDEDDSSVIEVVFAAGPEEWNE
jgi:transcriptional regulator of heat shock response